MNKIIDAENNWPAFDDIAEPRMVCFGTGNGSGSKLLQSYIDGHPEIYMVPGYQLMYLYPHWYQWKDELKDTWNWETIIKIFCIKHASVIDSRRIPANDGMANLGNNKDQWLEVNEIYFKSFLKHLLQNKPVCCRIFLLAVHYAYAFCRGEDLTVKKCLVYHIHVHEYGPRYLEKDFPDMLTIAMVRDPRSNINGRYRSTLKLDAQKLDRTDYVVYFQRTYYFIWQYLVESMECLKNLPQENIRVVRHEDMHYCLERLMKSIADFMGIKFNKIFLKSTFGGQLWWGSKIYDMAPMNKPNPRIVSLDWQQKLHPLDWFVIEGLFYDYCLKYDYALYKHKKYKFFKRILLFFAIFLPSAYELETFFQYLNPNHMKEFFKSAFDEATGRVPFKDYSFNAYYRHKWYNRGLNLWKERWFKKFIIFFQAQIGQHSGSIKGRVIIFANSFFYLIISSFRYFLAFLSCPYRIIKRGIESAMAFKRLIKKENCLPELIITIDNTKIQIPGI
ncbi:sulfotransferase [Desulfobacterales bacterium HSG17]|nr:sulfotransferase [Desulfobacterales bacterium HSG17]